MMRIELSFCQKYLCLISLCKVETDDTGGVETKSIVDPRECLARFASKTSELQTPWELQSL